MIQVEEPLNCLSVPIENTYKTQLYPLRKILQSTSLEDENEGMSFRLSQLSFSDPNKITINWIVIERITT